MNNKVIFITGDRGVGKSTSLFTVCEKIKTQTDHELCGFETLFLERTDGNFSDLIFRMFGSKEDYTFIAERYFSTEKKSIKTSEKGFTEAANRIFSLNTKNKFFIFDEIGFLETKFESFRNAVENKIKESFLSVAVVRKGNYNFINSLIEKYSHRVFEVTFENRTYIWEKIYKEIMILCDNLNDNLPGGI